MSGREDLVGQKVEMLTGQGSRYGEGKVISYTDVPSVTVEYADGTRQSWRADMVRPTTPKPERYAVVIERDLHRLVDGMRAVAHDSERRRDFDSHKGLTRVFEDAKTMLTAIDDGLPAVVVPSDALRELLLPPRTLTPPKHYYRRKIARFQTAVDEANRA